MAGHGEKFGRKKEAAIAAWLTARNNEEAAKTIGVSPTTLLRWQKLPEFECAYREARRTAFRQSNARLQQRPPRGDQAAEDEDNGGSSRTHGGEGAVRQLHSGSDQKRRSTRRRSKCA
jgi:hypothetical protein